MVEKMELHSRKNSDYAHGGPPLGNFERVGAILALYPNLDHSDPKIVAIDYMLKQLDACLWYWSMWRINGHTLSESIEKRWADVVVYSAIVEAMI